VPETPQTPPRATKDAAAGGRLGRLDVLRGVAALCVVFDHLSFYLLQHVKADVYQWFDLGDYGVFVFFLISGYIVPASLERKGTARTFWVSRLFRTGLPGGWPRPALPRWPAAPTQPPTSLRSGRSRATLKII